MTGQVKIDQEAVKSLAELLRETDLTEIEYQVDTLRIKVTRNVQQQTIAVPMSSAVNAAPKAEEIQENKEPTGGRLEDHPGVIEAQMVGTVYLTPGPESEPFVSVGSHVSQGQTLFIIEAMKVMNMIKSPRSGVIKHIFVKNGQPVEYGDPVIIVE